MMTVLYYYIMTYVLLRKMIISIKYLIKYVLVKSSKISDHYDRTRHFITRTFDILKDLIFSSQIYKIFSYIY